MFLVYGGTCLSRKAVHNWVEILSEVRSKVADDARQAAEAAETVKSLLCCGFRRAGKAMGQGCHCWWRICREINVSSFRFEHHMFYVVYPFVTYLLTLPRSSQLAIWRMSPSNLELKYSNKFFVWCIMNWSNAHSSYSQKQSYLSIVLSSAEAHKSDPSVFYSFIHSFINGSTALCWALASWSVS
jgi:hypothetical protein